MPLPNQFTIRIYGLLINPKQQVLVSDEFQLGIKMTKFPGGGLEFGEGPKDCLIREIKEECKGQELTNITHFYTTDFFQKALFYKNRQLLSIYYTAELKEPVKFKISTIPFDFENMENGNQSFRWVTISALKTDEFSFPIDKLVVEKLKEAVKK